MKNLHLDRRTKYSQKMIREAFLSLVKEKNINEITVTDICKMADVNRGTFYKYYQDVNDLFSQIENQFIQEIREMLEHVDALEEHGIEHIMRQSISILTEHEDYVRIVQTVHSARKIVEELFSSFQRPMLQIIQKKYPDVNDIQASYIVEYTIGGCSNLITKWLEDGKQMNNEEITALLTRLLCE